MNKKEILEAAQEARKDFFQNVEIEARNSAIARYAEFINGAMTRAEFEEFVNEWFTFTKIYRNTDKRFVYGTTALKTIEALIAVGK